MTQHTDVSRRRFLATTAAAAAASAGCLSAGGVAARAADTGAAAAAGAGDGAEAKALIAITLDLEMARNFPKWEDGRWDYEKGNLDDATKAYAVEAARRVKARGGVIHFFLVARALEQENV